MHAREVLARVCAIAAGVFAVLGALSLDVLAVAQDKPAAVLFPTEMSADDAFKVIVAAGGLPVEETKLVLWSGTAWIAAPGDPEFFARVKAHGALAVINPLGLGGCLLAGRS
jgi:hypothetical protein